MVISLRFDQTKEAATTNECTFVTCHFDSHGGATMHLREHPPKMEVQGFHTVSGHFDDNVEALTRYMQHPPMQHVQGYS